ncbi:MAG: hypothetical protein ACLR01_08380 [Vescimonas sp.]
MPRCGSSTYSMRSSSVTTLAASTSALHPFSGGWTWRAPSGIPFTGRFTALTAPWRPSGPRRSATDGVYYASVNMKNASSIPWATSLCEAAPAKTIHLTALGTGVAQSIYE